MIVTTHAIERFIERVKAVTFEEARAAIEAHRTAIDFAACIDARSVRIEHGARLMLCGDRVVTVLGRGQVDCRTFEERRGEIRAMQGR